MNHYLYLLLNLGSISVPLLYSVFEKKFHFIQYFRPTFLSVFLMAVPFIIWDVFFTSIGVWGFNSEYHLSLEIFQMPIEEWLFFFCIPYACLFTHEVLKYYFPNFKLSVKATVAIGFSLLLLVGGLLIFNFGKWYVTVNFTFFFILLGYALKNKIETLQVYFPSFVIILIPFFVINGILTGSFIEAPVVWYNNDENLGFRIFTIPVEDLFYAFNLLFSIQLIFNYLKVKKHEK